MSSDFQDAIVGGAMTRLTIKPRWYLYWSPKAWKKAKIATQIAHYRGRKLEISALENLVNGIDLVATDKDTSND